MGTLSRDRRGGRAVECGGLENRYPSLGGSRVQIPPPPLGDTKPALTGGFRRCRGHLATTVRLRWNPHARGGDWPALVRTRRAGGTSLADATSPSNGGRAAAAVARC